MNEIESRAAELAMVRERLSRFPRLRQRAVATFPLMVASVANDMKKMLDLADGYGLEQNSGDTDKCIEHCETMIREAYRNTFGRELGQ